MDAVQDSTQTAVKSSYPAAESKDVVEVWKQAIATQMHFNDLCVRSRQLGLTFVVAALGVAVVLLSNYPDARISLGGHNIHISAFIMFIAAFAVVAVWRLDLGVYHKMLRGSVAFVEEFDRSGFSKNFAGMAHGMTEFISVYSRKKDVAYTPAGFTFKEAASASEKVRIFYIMVLIVLLAAGALIALVV